MSDTEYIDKMSFKQLRSKVEELCDEIAVMKRTYDDMLNNLDNSNFSSAILKEKVNMKSQISVSAEKIKTMVSKNDLANKLSLYSTIEQTAEAISTKVSKDDLELQLSAYSTIEQTANYIQTRISKQPDMKNAIPINDISEATDTSQIYVIRQKNGDTVIAETYYYYSDLLSRWEVLSGDSIYTVFNQTADGFSLKGNVVIDGEAVITKNLTLSGEVTWDMSNSPVKTEYSKDLANWHSPMADDDIYMHMSFDGGQNWSDAVKVVGTDGAPGKNGTNGTNADVTPENVFNALTDNGAQQGIFAAFVNNKNQIYINTEYLNTEIAKVADTLYIGSISDTGIKHSIVFNNSANITTVSDGTGGAYSALKISASALLFSGCRLDLSGCTSVNWGSFKPVAVFG